MATVIIPDKICPHCGGNKWYVRVVGDKTYYGCAIKNAKRSLSYYHREGYKHKRKYNAEHTRKYVQKNKIILLIYNQLRKLDNPPNPIKAKEYYKRWYPLNKEFAIKKMKKWIDENRERHYKTCRSSAKRARERMSDNYLKKLFNQSVASKMGERLKHSEIETPIVQIYKKQLCLKRVLKQQKMSVI